MQVLDSPDSQKIRATRLIHSILRRYQYRQPLCGTSPNKTMNGHWSWGTRRILVATNRVLTFTVTDVKYSVDTCSNGGNLQHSEKACMRNNQIKLSFLVPQPGSSAEAKSIYLSRSHMFWEKRSLMEEMITMSREQTEMEEINAHTPQTPHQSMPPRPPRNVRDDKSDHYHVTGEILWNLKDTGLTLWSLLIKETRITIPIIRHRTTGTVPRSAYNKSPRIP